MIENEFCNSLDIKITAEIDEKETEKSSYIQIIYKKKKKISMEVLKFSVKLKKKSLRLMIRQNETISKQSRIQKSDQP